MIRRPPRSTLDRSSAASDVYKRQGLKAAGVTCAIEGDDLVVEGSGGKVAGGGTVATLSLIHISEPTRPY